VVERAPGDLAAGARLGTVRLDDGPPIVARLQPGTTIGERVRVALEHGIPVAATVSRVTDSRPTAKPFASSADLEQKRSTLEELAEGVYAFTAEGDPNLGAIVGPESVLCIDARATPTAAREWLAELRARTEKPVELLVLTHYHAVRVLGASAFDARHVVAHANTHQWIRERGKQDWESEYRRFPRLFHDAESIPGLTVPDVVFADQLTLFLGELEVQVRWLGGGHTAGDAVVWLPGQRILFAGDLVEARAAPYMGDALVEEWQTGTLAALQALAPEALVPGRGPALRGAEVGRAIGETREYLTTAWTSVRSAREDGGGLREAAEAARAALEPRFRDWWIFEHCFPFNVARCYDEAGGLEPQVWTAERDAAVWAELQG
jgi:glyoxylase-like metal-dependent hydrolase (beta-lactamase superfamily II)